MLAGLIYPGKLIAQGSNNTVAVTALQDRLAEIGFAKKSEFVRGSFNGAMEGIIRRYQKTKLLKVDGVVGQLTWWRLFKEEVAPVIIKPTAVTLGGRAWEIALTQLHVRELTGKNDGDEVKAYLKAVGITFPAPWCAAFVYSNFDKAANELGIPNPVPKTGGVLDMYRKAAKYQLPKSEWTNLEPGDCYVMNFGGGKGHIAIIGKSTYPNIFTVEGNTNEASSREGDGVYNRNRDLKSKLTEGILRFT